MGEVMGKCVTAVQLICTIVPHAASVCLQCVCVCAVHVCIHEGDGCVCVFVHVCAHEGGGYVCVYMKRMDVCVCVCVCVRACVST